MDPVLTQFAAISKHLPTHVFAVATVAADAADATVDHLDGAQRKLQQADAQQNGEQHHVPHHSVFGVVTEAPHSLIEEVTVFTPEGDKHCKGKWH